MPMLLGLMYLQRKRMPSVGFGCLMKKWVVVKPKISAQVPYPIPIKESYKDYTLHSLALF